MIHLHTARNFYWSEINFCDMSIFQLHYWGWVMVTCWSSKLHSFLPLNDLDLQLLYYKCHLDIWCLSKSQPCVQHSCGLDLWKNWGWCKADNGEVHVACENMQSGWQDILSTVNELVTGDFSYIAQMMRTTKAVYKECSHGKEARKHAHRQLFHLNCPKKLCSKFRHSNFGMLASLKDLGYCFQPWSYDPKCWTP